MFSAILTCRIKDNADSNLLRLLDSIKDNSKDHTGFEILIKFDTDDYYVPGMVRNFDKYPFKINYLVDRRGRGANDMHLGYTSLLSIARLNSEFFVTLSDDFVVKENWDATLLNSLVTMGEPGTDHQKWVLETLEGNLDVFIIQYTPHPGGTIAHRLNMNWKYEDIASLTGLEIAPGFSKKLIQLCGGFGHISFTDAWITLLQHELYHKHSLNITRFAPDEYAVRLPQGQGMDVIEAANRAGQAKYNFDQTAMPWYREIVQTQAQTIADYYRKYRQTILENNFQRKALSINPTRVMRHGEIVTHS